jgi:hypothetical protein
MNSTLLTTLIYLGATVACAISVWLAIRARRDLRNLRKGSLRPLPRDLASEVARLRSAGLDAARIAGKLGLAPGEVRFLLDLEKERGQRTTVLAAA